MEEKTENVTAASSYTLCSIIDDLQDEPMCAITPKRKSNLSVSTSTLIDIPPVDPPQPPNLSIQIQPAVSIPPRTVFHPAIINACQEMFGKTPNQLNHEEISEFKYYQEFKLSNGDPIEEDVAYIPVGGLRNCLQCGNLT